MSMVVRVVAPTGRDAQLIVTLLEEHGIASEPCQDLLALLGRGFNIGPLLLAEEALTPPTIAALGQFVHTQPPWSDVPILILTTNGRETEKSMRLDRERLPIGSPVLLERPIRPKTLLSSVEAAVRARRRQYEIRDALEERDAALAQLKAEQETLQTVLDNMPVGVAVATANGEITLVNPKLEEILGHAKLDTPDIESHGAWVAFHADGSRVKAQEYPLPRAILTGKPIPSEELQYERGDGRRVWIRLSAAPIVGEDGEVKGGVAAVTDVDGERRRAEILRRSEERFRLLVEQASIGVVIGDLGGNLTYVNPTLLQKLGYTHEDLETGAMRWDELTPSEYKHLDAIALDQLRTRGVAEPYQKAYLRKDGVPVPLLVGAVRIPVAEASGREEIAVFLTDLTSQKQAEAALIQSEKLAAVGRLAASISHEINNPLEAVTNLIFLAQSGALTDETRKYLEMAAEEVARVSQIAGQTLRFHRQSTRARQMTPRELVEPVLALYQGRMQNAQVRLNVSHRGEPAFTCYEGDIRQVLNNLVGNAIDAMRGNGTLFVRSGPATDAKTGNRGIHITVADSGHGMDEATLRRIFEPFYTTKGIHGTGLGLWISHGIVAKHQGRLSVRSSNAEGHSGTIFRLFLPFETAVAPSEAAAE